VDAKENEVVLFNKGITIMHVPEEIAFFGRIAELAFPAING